VGSRDGRQFASHAQKYFIKLCIKGVLLPSKVAESGCGYTLSGKLLDPESAAAKAYGFKEGMLQGDYSISILMSDKRIRLGAEICTVRCKCANTEPHMLPQKRQLLDVC